MILNYKDNFMEQIEDITKQKIEELLLLNIPPSKKVMEVINKNIKLWDSKLYVACKDADVNFLETIQEILALGGYEIDKATLTTYLNRARKNKKVAS